jgi:hypothetical protein
MHVQLYVLRSPVMYRVPGHIDGGYVVVEGHGRTGNPAQELAKEMTN